MSNMSASGLVCPHADQFCPRHAIAQSISQQSLIRVNAELYVNSGYKFSCTYKLLNEAFPTTASSSLNSYYSYRK